MTHLQLRFNVFGVTASNTTAGEKNIKNTAQCEAVLEGYLLERVYPRGLPVALGAKLVLIVFVGPGPRAILRRFCCARHRKQSPSGEFGHSDESDVAESEETGEEGVA